MSQAPAPNPDPSRWTLIRQEQIGPYLLAEVQYHDCTNFDGRKLMVFHGIRVTEKTRPAFLAPPKVADRAVSPQGWLRARAMAAL